MIVVVVSDGSGLVGFGLFDTLKEVMFQGGVF